MDKDLEQFGSLGFIGIYRESFRLIFKWKRIFSQITLALILPLCILSLAHSKVSELFFGKILTDTNLGAYRHSYGRGEIEVLIGRHGWISFWVFKVIYFILVLFLSLPSTAAVVYTIACLYTSKNATFRTAISVVPKLWKRLLVTFLWSFPIYLLFCATTLALFVIWAYFMRTTSPLGIAYFVIWLLCFIMAYFCITIICQLAYVVSVLEDEYGWTAIVKGRTLIKGKMGAAVGCYLVLLLLLIGVELVFELFVSVDAGSLGIGLRILIGLASLVVIMFLYLIELVYQTVIFFVCKSYHGENIDGPSLAYHLEGYKRIKDVQLERVNNV